MAQQQPQVNRWECPNCGQSYFGDDPPDMCDFCGDFTTWRPLPTPNPTPSRSPASQPPPRPHQPRLFDD